MSACPLCWSCLYTDDDLAQAAIDVHTDYITCELGFIAMDTGILRVC